MNKLPFLFAVFAVAPFVASASLDLSRFEHRKEIMLPSDLTAPGYARIVIDDEISYWAHPDLSDVRIVDRSGIEVPYRIVRSNEENVRYEQSVALSDLSRVDDQTFFLIDIGEEGRIHDKIQIQSSSRNFKKHVSVYASDVPLTLSDPSWRMLTDSGYIFDLSDLRTETRVVRGDVFYPQSTARYVKVVISGIDRDAIEVTNVSVSLVRTRSRLEDARTLPAMITQNTQFRTTEIVVDMGGSGIPVNRLSLEERDDRNFDRRVAVQVSSDAATWSPLGEGYVSSLSTPLFSGSSLGVSFSETQARYVRVIVFNEDDAPVEWIPRVTLVGPVRAAIFPFRTKDSYMLYFGAPSLRAPIYDIARYAQYIESADLPNAQAGEAEGNPLFAPPLPKEVSDDTSSFYLNVMLVLLVGSLSFLTLMYLKRLKLAQRGEKDGV